MNHLEATMKPLSGRFGSILPTRQTPTTLSPLEMAGGR